MLAKRAPIVLTPGPVALDGDAHPARLVGGAQVVITKTQPQERALPAEPPPVLEFGDADGGCGVVGQPQRRAAGGSDRPGRGDLDAAKGSGPPGPPLGLHQFAPDPPRTP